ncbi:hypothetical protein GJ744_000923 [Endocarpon pusillum]|uniref:Carbonyl reductase n=1 Tax=Endocarpon pusillum TaxID=364733 RepID=A0A8H7ATH5_9EURO|nr:hypothetical protein GJ744_000923 [Endocarpon pusillum]
MPYTHVGAVTGANKGIGLAIVRQLALQYPKSALHKSNPESQGLLIYLTARDNSRGEAAVRSLYEEDAQLKKSKALKKDGGWADIKFHPLDIRDTRSIRGLADYLRGEHGERAVDFVVNNAGIAMDGFDNNVVKTTLECNYYGSLEATQEFLPLLKPNGRLINVSSMLGKLNKSPL